MPSSISSSSSRFENQLEQNLSRLNVAGQGILLAVSGGRDSMALLHGVVRLREKLQIPHIIAGHLNHGLRGEAGGNDAELVRAACMSLGIPAVFSQCDAGELEHSSRGSLEDAARTARYDFLQTTAQQHGTPLIATAHHASDQAETILHNIIRGTGLRGLRGIPERRKLSDSTELIRPMLNIKSDEIYEYIQLHDIIFASDETNIDNNFTRNRIRHQLLPMLENDFNPGVQDSVLRLSEQTQELLASLDAAAELLLAESVLERTPDLCKLDVQQLIRHPEPVIRHAFTILWMQQNWPRREMSSDHWNRLSGLLFRLPPASLDLPGSIRTELRGNLLAFECRRQSKCDS